MLNSPIFTPRANLRPYEYPELLQYVDAIRHSYWIHTEFGFSSDIQDFKTQVDEKEKEALRKTMLAISQVEVAVKNFWGDIYKHIPKPEVGAVGSTFSECEVRHADAYAHLLEILGLNDDFSNLLSVPIIKERYGYLTGVSSLPKNDNLDYTKAIILFSLLIEHVSLFSQFLIMLSFNKHRNLFKGISNVVEATSKEEQIHGMFGIDLVKIIRKENPEWFNEKLQEDVHEFCRTSYEVERGVIDWIFESGELNFLSKDEVEEFIKDRINRALKGIGMESIFVCDESLLSKTDWFDDEILTTKHTDFFYKRSVNYNKKSKSITADDLF